MSHSERDLGRPSREEAYLSHIWWRRSRGNIVILVPEGERAYILVPELAGNWYSFTRSDFLAHPAVEIRHGGLYVLLLFLIYFQRLLSDK